MDGLDDAYVRRAFLLQRHGVMRADLPQWAAPLASAHGIDEDVWIRLESCRDPSADEMQELCPMCLIAFVRMTRLSDGNSHVHVGRHDACGTVLCC